MEKGERGWERWRRGERREDGRRDEGDRIKGWGGKEMMLTANNSV